MNVVTNIEEMRFPSEMHLAKTWKSISIEEKKINNTLKLSRVRD